MKLIRAKDDGFVFEFNAEEKRLLLDILKQFPLVPATHHRLSKTASAANQAENQRLLEESLATQKETQQKQIATMLKQPARFAKTTNGWRLTLSRTDIEWLLQVLNDVRVGSWLALGSPDLEKENAFAINDQTAPHVLRMEIAGHFEGFFLGALEEDIFSE